MRLFSRYSPLFLFTALSVVMLLPAPAGAENAIRFTSANAQAGEQVTIEIIMENDFVLGGAVVPFRWSSPDLTLLSISIVRDRFVGGMRDTSSIEGFGPQTGSVLLYPKISLFDRGMVPPGSGVIAQLLFAVSPTAHDQTVRIDSIHQQIAENAWRRPEYSDYDGLRSITPNVYSGQIIVGTGVPPPIVDVIPPRLDFSAVAGGTDQPAEVLEIRSANEAPFAWSAYWNSSWLVVSTSSGETPSYPFVAVDAGALSPGLYRDTITITAPEAENSPVRVPVTVQVRQPQLVVPAGEVRLLGVLDESTVEEVPVSIEGEAGAPLDWSSESKSAWLRYSPSAGTTPGTIVVTAELAALESGSYFDTILVSAPAAALSPKRIPVRLDITPSEGAEFDRYGIAVSPLHSNPYSLSSDASLRISYTLRDPMRIDLTVFDLLGRRVRTLVSEDQSSGSHEVDWDGRDGAGNLVSSGHYFYRITTPHGSVTRRVVMIK